MRRRLTGPSQFGPIPVVKHRVLHFGHSRARLAFWSKLTSRAIGMGVPTPFYLFSIEPIQEALRELETLECGLGASSAPERIPIRHWLSCKTQPVAPMLRWWCRQGRGIEVVSEFELLAAREEGFQPEHILVNGPAKDSWLQRHPLRGLRVNFDSPRETTALLPMARALDWSVGVRLHTSQEHDPENPSCPTQFGMVRKEAIAALVKLQRAKLRLETVHFHLRTNVASPDVYERAITDVAEVCTAARFTPKHLDCGGGLPPPNALDLTGYALNARFTLTALAQVYRRAVALLPGLRELWLENGRFVSARSGALVVKVLETKERSGLRHLICDGGRTTNALVSNWENHELLTLPRRGGPALLTAVCGPTCMAFDQLAQRPLSAGIRRADHLIWLDAGAYHIPWETRFSHGHAAVVWHEAGRLAVIRGREPFDAWWGQWREPPSTEIAPASCS